MIFLKFLFVAHSNLVDIVVFFPSTLVAIWLANLYIVIHISYHRNVLTHHMIWYSLYCPTPKPSHLTSFIKIQIENAYFQFTNKSCAHCKKRHTLTKTQVWIYSFRALKYLVIALNYIMSRSCYILHRETSLMIDTEALSDPSGTPYHSHLWAGVEIGGGMRGVWAASENVHWNQRESSATTLI